VSCRFQKLREHSQTKAHKRAEELLLGQAGGTEEQLEDLARPEDRFDVPCFSLCFAAYKGAIRGASFCTYQEDVEFARMTGSAIPRSRQSRMTAAQLVHCFGDILRAEDTELLQAATHIHLTMDSRAHNLVIRARMTLGSLPPQWMPHVPDATAGQTAENLEERRPIRNVFGVNILRADRLLAFRRVPANATTEDLSAELVAAVRDACKDDEMWHSVRSKVVAFTPDGAPDEQLAGRLAGAREGEGQSAPFPKLRFVLRCSGHVVVNAMKAAWGGPTICRTA